MELLEQREYEGEGARCQVVLGSLGKGFEESQPGSSTGFL